MDHWLKAFPSFCPVFGLFRGASGPLDRVGHWLEAFPDFWPVFGLFLGASGPLAGVDHWLKQKPCTDRQCRALSLVFKTFNVLVGLETGRAAIAGGCYNLAQVLLTHVAGCKNAWQASGHVVIRDDPAFCVGNS